MVLRSGRIGDLSAGVLAEAIGMDAIAQSVKNKIRRKWPRRKAWKTPAFKVKEETVKDKRERKVEK